MRLRVRIEGTRDRHELVDRVDPAAGKDEPSRHEFVALMTLAEEDLGTGPERSTRMSVAASFGRT